MKLSGQTADYSYDENGEDSNGMSRLQERRDQALQAKADMQDALSCVIEAGKWYDLLPKHMAYQRDYAERLLTTIVERLDIYHETGRCDWKLSAKALKERDFNN